LHDPRRAKSVLEHALAVDGVTEVLPAPPIGYAWVCNNFGYYNPHATGGTVTYIVRLGSAGDIVDQDTIAISTPGTIPTSMQGGLVAESSVTVEVTAGTGVVCACTAWLVPTTKIRYWRSPALTDAFQTVTLPGIPTGYGLTFPWAGMGAQSTIGWQWVLNLDAVSRTVQAQVTRGAEVYIQQGNSAGATARSTAGMPPLPLLIAGDTLELKCTAAPAASVFAGGAFVLVPLETRA